MNISYNRKRLIGGILALLFLPIWLNYFFELGFFGDYDKSVFIGAYLGFMAFIFRVGPSIEEMEEIAFRRDLDRYGQPKNRKWFDVAVTVLVMLVMLFATGTGGRIVRGEPLVTADALALIFFSASGVFIFVSAQRRRQALAKRLKEQD